MTTSSKVQETWLPRATIAKRLSLSGQQLDYLARTHQLRTRTNQQDRRQKLLCLEDVRTVLNSLLRTAVRE